MSAHDPDVEAWIDQARSADILEIATRVGAVLKRNGHEWVGPCPRCNGHDRFAVKPSEDVFVCRGAAGGDAIALVMHAGDPSRDIPFMEAVEIINGCPAPRRDSQAKPVDPEIAKERREERKDQQIARASVETQRQEKTSERAARIFESCMSLLGTDGDAYFRRRRITMTGDLCVDIRFARELEYWGTVEGEQDLKHLGMFPCVVSAIRNVAGEIIGIHRTYLDPKEPAKLTPPGDRKANKAKKVFGNWKGGGIRMSPIRPVMATGEGIETCASWYQMDYGPNDIGLICAVAIDNISGGSTGMLPHPRPNGNIKTIQNGLPDMNDPGLILPPEVEEIYLLGDGDSDAYATHAKMLTGARRFRLQGVKPFVHFAPAGIDWNDHLLGKTTAKRAA